MEPTERTFVNRRIAVLPDHLANKIAAGEVIQRPESAVKELLENSLDAGAQHITVIINDGGTSLIQVVDDGAGMDEQDAVASFLRHATSKIASYEELEAIRTYGFRGEALASIASVAQVTMKTRRVSDDMAVVVRIDGGGAPRISREGREPGTSISVQNLFFNVPARRKFLKTVTTEFRHVYDAVHRIALGRPDVAITFISDNEPIFDLKPAAVEQRMIDLFGERQFAAMIPVEEETDLLAVRGFIGKPTFGQRTRFNQYLFLNGRFIVNRTINHAVFTAYENLLLKGTFPLFLLFIEVDPRRVDVNVHPSKMEAKFEEEQGIYRVVSTLVRKALAVAGGGSVPVLTMDGMNRSDPDTALRFTPAQHMWPGEVDRTTGEILGPAPAAGSLAARLFAPLAPSDERMPPQPSLTHDGDRPEETSGALIWQLHNKYILSQIRNGVMIVDQHVAHERVLYERALQRFENRMQTAQQLLFPYTVQLSAGDYTLVKELLQHFTLLGFDIKLFGKNTIVIEGVPPDVKGGQEDRIVQDMLALYKEYQQHAPMDARDNLAKSFSCRSAIKAGDPLSEQEMRSLIDQLFATKMPYVCPHGRPVVLRISIEELDRRFGRT
jgi:DNA mismatch repair protein MutL